MKTKTFPIKIIAHIHTDFPSKFGIPRQSGLVPSLRGTIIFEHEYRNPDALRGLEGYSHIWLLWQFSQSLRENWSPTVRPPRLGGNTRMGVFATRSPFRPNAIGLSSVKLEGIELKSEFGPIIHVSGTDMLDMTPIFDIKPYLPFTDNHPEASGGFADEKASYALEVDFPNELLSHIPPEDRDSLIEVLAEDPRPSYQDDAQRIYGMEFGKFEIKFKVSGDTLKVCGVHPRNKS